MTYLRIPVVTDPETLSQSVFAYIQGQAPNWTPQDGNLDVWIIRAVAALAAQNRDLASDVQDDIYRYFGATIVGIAPLDATAAQGNTTWLMLDTVGHTIPAGTNVAITDAAGNMQPFTVLATVVIPSGSNTTQSGQVVIMATNPGSAANNVGVAGGPVQLIDVLDWVQSITLVEPTVGGIDAETDADYLNRLTTRMQRMSNRPILPADFAAMALDASTVVQRAVAVDGYNPANQSYNNERMVAVAAVDVNGQAVPANVQSEIQTYLQANREVNFIVNTMSPTYTTINVTVTVNLLSGFDPTATNAAVQTAIQTYLSPANWAVDPTLQQQNAANSWVETDTLYYNELVTQISNVQGVYRVISMTINGGTTDVNLATPAALTQPGTITVTNA